MLKFKIICPGNRNQPVLPVHDNYHVVSDKAIYTYIIFVLAKDSVSMII